MTTKIVNEVQKQHNADMPLLPLLTESEQYQLAAWNETQQNYSRDACVPHLVAGQAATTPGAVALVAGLLFKICKAASGRRNATGDGMD